MKVHTSEDKSLDYNLRLCNSSVKVSVRMFDIHFNDFIVFVSQVICSLPMLAIIPQTSKVSEIMATRTAMPMEIRVLHKWRPYRLKPTLSYMFLNENVPFV